MTKHHHHTHYKTLQGVTSNTGTLTVTGTLTITIPVAVTRVNQPSAQQGGQCARATPAATACTGLDVRLFREREWFAPGTQLQRASLGEGALEGPAQQDAAACCKGVWCSVVWSGLVETVCVVHRDVHHVYMERESCCFVSSY